MSEDHAPKVELKPLPLNLKHAFLSPNSICPIGHSSIHVVEIENLICVLREHRKSIGYTIDDLVGIDLKYCMQRIYLEDYAKPRMPSGLYNALSRSFPTVCDGYIFKFCGRIDGGFRG